MHRTQQIGTVRPRTHHVSVRSVDYDKDSQAKILLVLRETAQDGWEPIGTVLVPLGKRDYSIAVFIKAKCIGPGCPFCVEELWYDPRSPT
jgi:hypothetical protein